MAEAGTNDCATQKDKIKGLINKQLKGGDTWYVPYQLFYLKTTYVFLWHGKRMTKFLWTVVGDNLD